MNELVIPRPVKHKYFTPGTIVLTLLAINGLVFLALRFINGLGFVTNLNNQYPWGLWIGVDVAAGVALAAGGFVTAAIGHIFRNKELEPVLRPALLTAMLGYTFVALGVFIDIGRWYYIWHPIIMWNGNSPLFEVGICVMAYLTVLYIEFIPILTERFRGKVNIGFLTRPIEWILRALDNTFGKVMFLFIIAGVVLSTLHQSSLGTLMVIAGQKLHPLWQTPVLPLMFFISAICVGLPMVIFESLLASRSFKLEPEMNLLSKIAGWVPILLWIYLAFKVGDLVIRQAFGYLTVLNVQSIAFYIEMIVGVILPIILFSMQKVLKSKTGLLIAATLVVAGVLINRINVFIIAYHPPYAQHAYFPSIGEFSVTIGFISLLVLLYRAIVIIFPVISQPVLPLTSSKKEV